MVLKANSDGELPEDHLPGLDIAMPYLAGTYDDACSSDCAPVPKSLTF